jgi:hypothetical protein
MMLETSRMRHFIWRIVLNSLAAAEAARRSRPRCILVFGHMRSGSSLVNHILASHPDISAVGERNAPYRSAFDLDRLVAESRIRNRRWNRRFLFAADQVNHNRFLTSDAILVHPRVIPVLLAREPVATVTSIVRVLGPIYGGLDRDEAVSYYIERLTTLTRYLKIVSRRDDPPICIDYDVLVDRPNVTLRSLSVYLKLTEPLTPEYRIRAFTGKRGDPSSHIGHGFVSRPEARPRVRIPEAGLARALAAYREFLDTAGT